MIANFTARAAIAAVFVLAASFPSESAARPGAPESRSPESRSLDTKCGVFGDLFPGGYCVTRTQGSANPDVLYYLHGSGSSESTWMDAAYYTSQVRQYWSETGAQPPAVVSISFGPRWLLAQKNASAVSGLFEAFTQVALPRIEAALGGVKGDRMLLGESMGGFNSIQLALKTSLFKKAAILCAPIGEISPFSSTDEIEAFIRKTRANSELVRSVIQLGRAFFSDEEAWAKASPLELARGFDPSSGPAIYLAAGYYDEYGLFAGNEAFAAALAKKGARLDWRPQWGGHCAIDIPSLATFLTR